MNVKAIILTGFGINCDWETAEAFRRAGADAQRVHLNEIIVSPALLENCHILAVPGGFSFGDDIASGKVLANRLRYKLGEPLKKFVADGKLMIGICNGFQALVKLGILPRLEEKFVQEATLTYNDSGRFENRWVNLVVEPRTRCAWLRGISQLELTVRHGEGKFVPRDSSVLERLRANGQVALRYAHLDGTPARGAYPANPNGSIEDIAGICDPTGRVFGLMPHPEAHVDYTHHPCWTRRLYDSGSLPVYDEDGPGLHVLQNAIAYAKEMLRGSPRP